MLKKPLHLKRTDNYYKKAKEQNYRSRASFKLIQLNEKYDFIKDSGTIVDLCAAPGGMLQVCRRFSAPSTRIIGVDIFPIKSIDGVETFIGDITDQRTSQILKTLLDEMKADLIIHDGSPNIGLDIIDDTRKQIELVLASMKICTEILRKGGVFISKVFRSSDYLRLQSVVQRFFEKVEGRKPPASRNSSIEIYLVCTGYLSPKEIDNELLKPKNFFIYGQKSGKEEE